MVRSDSRIAQVPRYDGRTLKEWLVEVEFERKPKRLEEALHAVRATAKHPANAVLTGDSIKAIFLLMRQYGQRVDGTATASNRLSELAWLTLTVNDGNPVSSLYIHSIS